MIGLIGSFLITCFVTAFACTVVKEDEDIHLLHGTLRLFAVLVGGIGAFALAVQVVTLLAG